MHAAAALRSARSRAGLSLRELARRAGTSHPTLAAYEAGHKVPSVETFDRVLRAAGYAVSLELTPAVGGTDPAERGRELVEVLELAARFPARHSATLRFPRFASVNAGSGARAPRVNAGSGARAPRVNAGSGARAPRVNA